MNEFASCFTSHCWSCRCRGLTFITVNQSLPSNRIEGVLISPLSVGCMVQTGSRFQSSATAVVTPPPWHLQRGSSLHQTAVWIAVSKFLSNFSVFSLISFPSCFVLFRLATPQITSPSQASHYLGNAFM